MTDPTFITEPDARPRPWSVVDSDLETLADVVDDRVTAFLRAFLRQP